MKKFEFRDVTRKHFIVSEIANSDWTNIIFESSGIGLIYREAFSPKGLAKYRVAILVYAYGAVRLTHVFKNRFRTMDDAKAWCLEKQVAIFDQYCLSTI